MKAPVVCLAGSMAQKPLMEKIARNLTWKGCVVLSPVDMKISPPEIKKHGLEKMMEFFRAVQYSRIMLADLVIAVPKKDGTLGDGTIKETDFANKYGRVVLKISKVEEIDSEEIKLALSKSKKNTLMDLTTLLMEALNVMDSLKSSQKWICAITEILKENDKLLFADYNVARDSMTKILRDANENQF